MGTLLRVLGFSLLLSGCAVADAASRTDLASFGVGEVKLRPFMAPITMAEPMANRGLTVELRHQSEAAGDCPGIDPTTLESDLSGAPGRMGAPGGRSIFVDRSICFPAELVLTFPTDPTETNGRLSIHDPSMRIEVEVDRFLAPLSIDPHPKDVSSIERGRALSFRVPGFGAADFDAESSSFRLATGAGSTYDSNRLAYRVVGDAIEVDVPGDLELDTDYRLTATVGLRLNVTRCDGAPRCTVTPLQVQAEYRLKS